MTKERYYATQRDRIDRFREEYEFLSNFYPAKLAFDGIVYENSESAYQAQKLADPNARKQFTRRYADEAKRMGQKVDICCAGQRQPEGTEKASQAGETGGSHQSCHDNSERNRAWRSGDRDAGYRVVSWNPPQGYL